MGPHRTEELEDVWSTGLPERSQRERGAWFLSESFCRYFVFLSITAVVEGQWDNVVTIISLFFLASSHSALVHIWTRSTQFLEGK